MPTSGSLPVEVRSLTDMKLEVLGGLSKKTMVRSCPPVREAKWWTRSSVFGRAASIVQEGARRSTRSSRAAASVLGLVFSVVGSGMARSWVSSLFSACRELVCAGEAAYPTHLEASGHRLRSVKTAQRRKKDAF